MGQRDNPRHRFRLAMITVALGLAACLGPGGSTSKQAALSSTVPSGVRAPATIERLAIVYPTTSDRELLEAYHRLEGRSFQLKAHRPSLQIVDRVHLERVLGEQRLQLTGLVSDEYAARVGRLLGVHGILVYHIEPPTYRQRFFTRHGYGDAEDSPGFVIVSKIIVVETAEVVYHNVVTARGEGSGDSASVSLRDVLDEAIARTVADLLRAFQ